MKIGLYCVSSSTLGTTRASHLLILNDVIRCELLRYEKSGEIMKCKLGNHEWIHQEDADKCCNGYKRILVFGDTTGCSNRGSDLLPGGTRYGYKWEPV